MWMNHGNSQKVMICFEMRHLELIYNMNKKHPMNLIDKLLRSNLFKTSLRIKVMVVFILPMILILSVFSYVHNLREQRELMEQIQTSTIRLGDMALSGMKNAMLRNDQEVVTRILRNYGTNRSITKMQIIDLEFRVEESTNPNEIGQIMQTAQAGCIECHKYPAQDRSRAVPLKINDNMLRVITPIPNSAECQACHLKGPTHLGILLIDTPLDVIAEHSKVDQIYNIGISIVSILIVTILAYILIQWLIVKRVGVLYEYLNAFAAGNFSIRIPNNWRTEDEITKLADHFNAIADTLEHDQKMQREIASVRQEAVAEERDRIARELHDGVAQFIGYVNTKAMAVRLLIQKGRIEDADKQLLQIEQAVREQGIDVRASIIGLKMASESGSGLATGLEQFIDQCRRLSDFSILLDIEPQAETVRLDPETELHLLRVVQEAMSNIRKHAAPKQVFVSMTIRNDELVLLIKDDGVGFSPWRWGGDNHAHFGLKTIRERVETIGGILSIESEPGHGTTVTVRLKIKEH
jgi:signal transduction histidine kinase